MTLMNLRSTNEQIQAIEAKHSPSMLHSMIEEESHLQPGHLSAASIPPHGLCSNKSSCSLCCFTAPCAAGGKLAGLLQSLQPGFVSLCPLFLCQRALCCLCAGVCGGLPAHRVIHRVLLHRLADGCQAIFLGLVCCLRNGLPRASLQYLEC